MTWAIEDGHGFARRLADGLLLAGQEVVWAPTRLMMAHRKLHAATGAKSDPVDAAATAQAAIATPGLDRHRIDEPVRELRVLVDHRADLVKRRNTVINQFKAQLHMWLDHTPGDLVRAKTVTAVGALLAGASLRPYVRQTLTDMLTGLATWTSPSRSWSARWPRRCCRSPASAKTPRPCSLPRSVTSPASPVPPSWPATPAAPRFRCTPPTESATGCTEEGTGS